MALVTFPAASSILTSPDYYGLTSTAYGGLFLPQAIAAIVGVAGRREADRHAGRQAASSWPGSPATCWRWPCSSSSQFFIGAGPLPYAMLLLATTSLGIGFGLDGARPSTRFAAAFFPAAADRAVLYLNALLGLGTALAPVLVAVFVGLGLWWGLPRSSRRSWSRPASPFSLGLPLARSDRRPAPGGARAARVCRRASGSSPAFALLYGIVETMNGNWATLYMTRDLGGVDRRRLAGADDVLGRW